MLGKLVTFGPTLAISRKSEHPLPVQRSIRKPSSLFELSVHARSILLVETALPVRLLGAAGTAGVGVGVGVGIGVGSGVGVGVGVGEDPQVGNLKEPILVRQLKLVVDA